MGLDPVGVDQDVTAAHVSPPEGRYCGVCGAVDVRAAAPGAGGHARGCTPRWRGQRGWCAAAVRAAKGTESRPSDDGATEHGGDTAKIDCPSLREIRLSLHEGDRRYGGAGVSPWFHMVRSECPESETVKGEGSPPERMRGCPGGGF
ncbi:hypothetical protein GCM10023079_39350 [Streptomyces chitinivorans]